jgi:hypothetical protein
MLILAITSKDVQITVNSRLALSSPLRPQTETKNINMNEGQTSSNNRPEKY